MIRNLARLATRRPDASAAWTWGGALSVVALLSYPLPFAWLGFAGLLSFLLLGPRSAGRRLARSPLIWPLGLYLAGGLVGLLVTSVPKTAEIRFFGLLAALTAALVICGAVDSVDIAAALVGFARVGVTLTLPLVFLLGLSTLQEERQPAVVVAGLDALTSLLGPVAGALDRLQVLAGGQRYRLQPSGLGALAAFGLLLTFGSILRPATSAERRWALTQAACCAVFLLLAGNRGALFYTLLIGLLLTGLVWRRARLPAILLACAVLGLALWLLLSEPARLPPPPLLPGAVSDAGPLLVRLQFWRNCLFLLGDFPFTGVGLGVGAVRLAYYTYFLPPADRLFGHSHNMLLQSWLEQGPLGLIGLLSLAAVGLALVWPRLLQPARPGTLPVAISISGGLLVLLSVGMTTIVPVTTVGFVLLVSTLTTLAMLPAAIDRPALGGWLRPRALGVLGAVLGLALVVLSTLGRPGTSVALNRASVVLTQDTFDAPRTSTAGAGRLAAAAELLRTAAAADPTSVALLRQRTAVALAAGDLDAADRHLADAAAIASPDDRPVQFQLGRLAVAAGDLDRAVAFWTAAAAQDQLNDWSARLLDAGLAGERPDLVAAAGRVTEATIVVAPALAEPYHRLAVVQARLAGPTAALARLIELADQYQDVPWPAAEVARLQRQLGQPVEALRWEQRAAVASASAGWEQRRLAARQARP